MWRAEGRIGLRSYVGAVLALLCLGCAQYEPLLSLDKVHVPTLVQKPPGVIVLVPEKRVKFGERLFRPLLEVRINHYSFDGIWDPGPVLGDSLVRVLHAEYKLPTAPLWTRLDPVLHGDLVATAEALMMKAAQRIEVVGVNIPDQHYVKYLKAPPPEAFRLLRQKADIEFLLELSIEGITVFRIPPTFLTVSVNGRLIRLFDLAVLWINVGGGITRIRDIEKFSDLEADNLALLKQHYENALRELVKADNPSNVFKGFVPVDVR